MKKGSWWESFNRLIRMRLILPLKRSIEDPVILSRGVLVGVMWAFTPLVGIQMTTVLITWIIVKRYFKWSFSLPIAIAFTWLTNVFTMIPVYYVFYVTGKIMLMDWGHISGWDSVKIITVDVFFGDYSTWESIKLFGQILLKDWGLAMAVGCIPWSIGLGWLSYKWSLAYLRHRQEIRRRAPEKRAFWRAKLNAKKQSGRKHGTK